MALTVPKSNALQGKTGIPAGVQRLIYSGRELDDDQSVYGSGLEASSTLHLVFRLRGGKGGFGSLLRSAGTLQQALSLSLQMAYSADTH